MARQVNFKFLSKNVTTAGTAEALSATPIKTTQFEVYAKSANTNNVYVGDSTVSSSSIPQAPDVKEVFIASEISASTKGDFFDLSKIYIDVDTNGEGVIVRYLVLQDT